MSADRETSDRRALLLRGNEIGVSAVGGSLAGRSENGSASGIECVIDAAKNGDRRGPCCCGNTPNRVQVLRRRGEARSVSPLALAEPT